MDLKELNDSWPRRQEFLELMRSYEGSMCPAAPARTHEEPEVPMCKKDEDLREDETWESPDPWKRYTIGVDEGADAGMEKVRAVVEAAVRVVDGWRVCDRHDPPCEALYDLTSAVDALQDSLEGEKA